MASHGPFRTLRRFPTGFSFGQNFCAIDAETTTTWALSSRSAVVKPRPRRIGMRKVEKYSDVAVRKSTAGKSAGAGAGRPSISIVRDTFDPLVGMLLIAAACSTPATL